MKNFKLFTAFLMLSVGSVLAKEYTDLFDQAKLDAFKKAYSASSVLGLGVLDPRSGEHFQTDLEAAQVYAINNRSGYLDYVRGKCIKKDIPGLLKVHPCTLFSEKHIESMSEESLAEFTPMINRCSALNANIDKAKNTIIDPSQDYSASFAFISPPCNHIPHKDLPHNQALKLIQNVADYKKEQGSENSTEIANMSLCYKSKPSEKVDCHRFQLLSMQAAIDLLKQCEKQS